MATVRVRALAVALAFCVGGLLLPNAPVVGYPPGTSMVVIPEDGPTYGPGGPLPFIVKNAPGNCFMTVTMANEVATGMSSGQTGGTGTFPGFFVAPTVPGTYTITASGCGETAFATITVIGPMCIGPASAKKGQKVRLEARYLAPAKAVKKQSSANDGGGVAVSRGDGPVYVKPSGKGKGKGRKARWWLIKNAVTKTKYRKINASGSTRAKFRFKKKGTWAWVVSYKKNTIACLIEIT